MINRERRVVIRDAADGMDLIKMLPYLILVIGSLWPSPAQGLYIKECGKPSDVVFLLDSSGSIYKHEFERQLAFVNSVIGEFDIAPSKMRVGAISFSNWAFLEFYLDTHRTKFEIQDAVIRVPHSRGDTNTAAALTFLKDNMFQFQHGGRPGVPRVAIVLTDGESNDPMQTAYVAEAARRMGIQIFAIGIGHKVNIAELKNIASYPPQQYMFHVASYDALKSIKDTVAIKACEATTPKPISTTPLPPDDSTCGKSVMADVVLAVSPRGSDENTEKALEFFRELTRGFDVSHDKVHVGLVPKDCRDIPEIDLKTFTSRDEALDTIDRLTRQAQADTTDVLRYMRKASFSQRFGARSRAKKLALVIVDETPDNMAAARKEAERLQVKKGVELFVIGVGKHVKPGKLRRLATDPDDQHMFHVANYDDLYSIVPIVQQAVCPVPLL